jgi:hypothetical protein
MFRRKMTQKDKQDEGYWKDGNYYVKGRVVCGICAADLGKSDKPEGELGYDRCEG